MPKQLTTTHTLIERQLVIYKRERSAIWQCRYQVDSKWQRTSTSERDLDKAKARAHELLIEANVRKKLNVAPITRYFKDIAKLAIQRMEKELRDGNGKIMYKEYIAIIQNYLSKYFGKHYIDSIDYQLIQNFDKWREEKLGRVPARSTLLNHNAALNRVFDEAVIRGFIVNSNRPKLVAKGKEGERRDDFSLEEVRAIRSNFDAWIARGKVDSIAIRELLKDYVLMLLDTGARAGAELLDLKWVQIERKHDPVITKTAEVDEEGEHGGEAIELVNLNRGAIIYIEKHKTKPRYIYGRAPTVQALTRIAKRNYGKAFSEMLEEKSTDYVFTYVEYVSKEDKEKGKVARLLRPTSLNKLFETYLTEHDLLISPVTNKRRVLYSLRHTYATLALTHDGLTIHTLAEQMGTSVGMIEKHYSHLNVIKARHQLQGTVSRELIEADADVSSKYAFDERKVKKKAVKKTTK